jgi:hypothetical protein
VSNPNWVEPDVEIVVPKPKQRAANLLKNSANSAGMLSQKVANKHH